MTGRRSTSGSSHHQISPWSQAAPGKALEGDVRMPAGTTGELVLPLDQKTKVRVNGRKTRPDKPVVLTGGSRPQVVTVNAT